MLTVKKRLLDPDGATLSLEGWLVLGGDCQQVEWQLEDLLRENKLKVVLDLTGLTYIDSAGVGELMSCFTSMRNQGGHLKLMNLQKNVHNLLQITKLYTIFEIAEDEATAIKSFQLSGV